MKGKITRTETIEEGGVKYTVQYSERDGEEFVVSKYRTDASPEAYKQRRVTPMPGGGFAIEESGTLETETKSGYTETGEFVEQKITRTKETQEPVREEFYKDKAAFTPPPEGMVVYSEDPTKRSAPPEGAITRGEIAKTVGGIPVVGKAFEKSIVATGPAEDQFIFSSREMTKQDVGETIQKIPIVGGMMAKPFLEPKEPKVDLDKTTTGVYFQESKAAYSPSGPEAPVAQSIKRFGEGYTGPKDPIGLGVTVAGSVLAALPVVGPVAAKYLLGPLGVAATAPMAMAAGEAVGGITPQHYKDPTTGKYFIKTPDWESSDLVTKTSSGEWKTGTGEIKTKLQETTSILPTIGTVGDITLRLMGARADQKTGGLFTPVAGGATSLISTYAEPWRKDPAYAFGDIMGYATVGMAAYATTKAAVAIGQDVAYALKKPEYAAQSEGLIGISPEGQGFRLTRSARTFEDRDITITPDNQKIVMQRGEPTLSPGSKTFKVSGLAKEEINLITPKGEGVITFTKTYARVTKPTFLRWGRRSETFNLFSAEYTPSQMINTGGAPATKENIFLALGKDLPGEASRGLGLGTPKGATPWKTTPPSGSPPPAATFTMAPFRGGTGSVSGTTSTVSKTGGSQTVMKRVIPMKITTPKTTVATQTMTPIAMAPIAKAATTTAFIAPRMTMQKKEEQRYTPALFPVSTISQVTPTLRAKAPKSTLINRVMGQTQTPQIGRLISPVSMVGIGSIGLIGSLPKIGSLVKTSGGGGFSGGGGGGGGLVGLPLPSLGAGWTIGGGKKKGGKGEKYGYMPSIWGMNMPKIAQGFRATGLEIRPPTLKKMRGFRL